MAGDHRIGNRPYADAVKEVNTVYAALEAFIVQFEEGGDKFMEAVNDYEFFSSIQSKVLRTPVLNDIPSEDPNATGIDNEKFERDVPMAWYTVITKALFALYILSHEVHAVRASSTELTSTNGDKFRMCEAMVPCPRLGYREYIVVAKVDNPNNKLPKIGAIFVNGELAIKAPYDMEEYIMTVIQNSASKKEPLE